MAQSIRERIDELGVLKTLGFSDGGSSRWCCSSRASPSSAAALGLRSRGRSSRRAIRPGAAADVLSPAARSWCSARLVLALGIGTGILPAFQASRLKIVDALRGTEDGTIVHELARHRHRRHGRDLRSIRQRLGSSIVAIIGIAGVVIVFTAVLSIAEGFRARCEDRRPADGDRAALRQRHRDDERP